MSALIYGCSTSSEYFFCFCAPQAFLFALYPAIFSKYTVLGLSCIHFASDKPLHVLQPVLHSYNCPSTQYCSWLPIACSHDFMISENMARQAVEDLDLCSTEIVHYDC